MDPIGCSFAGCPYTTPGRVDPAVVAVLLSTHAMEHQTSKAKAKPIKRPEMTSGGTTEAWSYFLTRWKTYSRAVALDGQDRVAQLLECCDDKLRRDMTRNTVGSHIEDLGERGAGNHEDTGRDRGEPQGGQRSTLKDVPGQR